MLWRLRPGASPAPTRSSSETTRVHYFPRQHRRCLAARDTRAAAAAGDRLTQRFLAGTHRRGEVFHRLFIWKMPRDIPASQHPNPLSCVDLGTCCCRENHDEKDFNRSGACYGDRQHDGCAGPIQSRPDLANRYRSKPRKTPARWVSRLLRRGVSRARVFAGSTPAIAFVSSGRSALSIELRRNGPTSPTKKQRAARPRGSIRRY
jgi:hypothetical protein